MKNFLLLLWGGSKASARSHPICPVGIPKHLKNVQYTYQKGHLENIFVQTLENKIVKMVTLLEITYKQIFL